jgi:hypothetical protein
VNKELTEFLTIEPKKEYSNFYKEDIFIIPCRVIEIGEEASHNSVWVKIQYLNFDTGTPVEGKAVCYKKSLRYFSDEKFPFDNECSILKMNNEIKFLIYGRFDPHLDVTHWFFGTYEGKSKEELKEVFKKNYIKLNNWLKESSKFA